MPSILNATTTSGLVTSADNSGSLQLQTNNGTTAVTIDTSQNVGVGTTSPVAKLQTNSTDGTIAIFRTTSGANNSRLNIDVSDSAGTAGFAVGGNSSFPALTFANGGSERMRIDSSGRVTTPNQPAFMAYLNNSFTNASPQTIVFDITQFNTGSNYSTSTGRFTAPVTGLYQFNIVVLVQGSSATMHDLNLQVNGSNYKNGRINAPDSTVNYSCAIRLNANDYVSVYVSSTGRPIYGASDWTYFSGFLVG